ncbi:hypothetical protein D3C72_1976300 [compost metagenome]
MPGTRRPRQIDGTLFRLDSPVFAQSRDLCRVIAKLTQYLRIMFAQLGADPLARPRRFRQLGHDPWHLEVLAIGQFGLQEHFPGEKLRVAEHVFGAEDPAGGDFGLVQLFDHAIKRQ